jgi:hypothetical protein
MRIYGQFALLVLVLASAGCSTVVAKSGDAKVVKCPQLIHTRGSKMFRMELPTVSVAQSGTHVLRVRGLPEDLKGLFKYELSLPVPYEEAFPGKNSPWRDAKISVAFRRLDGTEAFKQTLPLGTTSHGFSQSHDGWEAGWNLGAGPNHMEPVPTLDDSFDIVFDVEQPSRRASDRMSLRAYAVYIQKP